MVASPVKIESKVVTHDLQPITVHDDAREAFRPSVMGNLRGHKMDAGQLKL